MSTLQLQFLVWIFAGRVNRSQQDVIEYLQERPPIFHLSRDRSADESLEFVECLLGCAVADWSYPSECSDRSTGLGRSPSVYYGLLRPSTCPVSQLPEIAGIL